MKKYLSYILLLIFSLVLVGCGTPGTDDPGKEPGDTPGGTVSGKITLSYASWGDANLDALLIAEFEKTHPNVKIYRDDSITRDFICVEKAGDNAIIVYDSGTGVIAPMEDVLFEALQSGKDYSERRGMGLYIVQQLLQSFEANIELLPERNKYGNRYKFMISYQQEV